MEIETKSAKRLEKLGMSQIKQEIPELRPKMVIVRTLSIYITGIWVPDYGRTSNWIFNC